MLLRSIVCFSFLLLAPIMGQEGFLGVESEVEENSQAMVSGVFADSAASFLGLEIGDVILSVGDRKIRSGAELSRVVSTLFPGSLVELQVARPAHDGVLTLRGLLGRRVEAPILRQGSLPFSKEELRSLLEHTERFSDSLPDSDFPLLSPGFPTFPSFPGFPWEPQEGPGLGNMKFFDFGSGDSNAYLRYPENTPENERETLRKQAQEKYGEEAVVEFKGVGTEVRLTTRHSNLNSSPAVERDTIPEDLEAVLDSKGQVFWHPDLEAAQEASQISGKPVLIHFSADWCIPCRQLSADVLHNMKWKDLLSSFEPVLVNIESNGDLAQQWAVTSIPDLRVLDSFGREVGQVQGYSGEKETVDALLLFRFWAAGC